MVKRLFSILLALMLGLILYTLPSGKLLIPLLILPFISFALGGIFLALLGVFLVLKGYTNILGIFIIALSLLLLEITEMERAEAPKIHYVYAIIATFLSIPAYLFVLLVSQAGVGIEVTLLAIILAFLVYLFFRYSFK